MLSKQGKYVSTSKVNKDSFMRLNLIFLSYIIIKPLPVHPSMNLPPNHWPPCIKYKIIINIFNLTISIKSSNRTVSIKQAKKRKKNLLQQFQSNLLIIPYLLNKPKKKKKLTPTRWPKIMLNFVHSRILLSDRKIHAFGLKQFSKVIAYDR